MTMLKTAALFTGTATLSPLEAFNRCVSPKVKRFIYGGELIDQATIAQATAKGCSIPVWATADGRHGWWSCCPGLKTHTLDTSRLSLTVEEEAAEEAVDAALDEAGNGNGNGEEEGISTGMIILGVGAVAGLGLLVYFFMKGR